MKALDAAGSRALDAATISAGTPGILLMERAAAALHREIERAARDRPERLARVVVLAGTGNNGGDGFEVARLLQGRARVETLLLGDPGKVAGDAATTLRRLTGAAGPPRVVTAAGDLEALASASLVVDALFGTGLARPLQGLAAEAAERCGAGGAFVVAVDLPSGLLAGSASLPGPHVTADLTVTFGTPKLAHLLLPAASACGRVHVADIGLATGEPDPSLPEAVTAADIAPLFPRRPAAAHKGDYGRLLVVGGSDGMAGAPALAARAAHRAGAGLVTVAAPEAVRAVAHHLSPESTTRSPRLPFEGFDALAVGPGLGQTPAALGLVRRAVECGRPAVFDADALNLLSGRPEEVASRSAPTVLTPHPAEAARLLSSTTADVNADREGAARELARRGNAVVVLKGFRSVVADPEGGIATVLAGNPGMAAGGSGDVLTGVVGAFLARGMSARDAARAGAFLHGLAGDLARERYGEESMGATDQIACLESAFDVLSTWRRRA